MRGQMDLVDRSLRDQDKVSKHRSVAVCRSSILSIKNAACSLDRLSEDGPDSDPRIIFIQT